MCDKSNTCGKTIKTIINAFGNEEVQTCVLEKSHKGRCSYKWVTYLKNLKNLQKVDLEKLIDKIHKASYMTNGETAKNSPIINRTYRYIAKNEKGENLIPVTGKEKQILKEQGKFRVAVRKDELATFEECQKVEEQLVCEVLKVFSEDTSHECFFCGETFTPHNFISKNRKDPNSAQHGHINPLSDNVYNHKSGNVSWIHRECNLMQSDGSIEEKYKKMKKVVEYQQKKYGF